jgi:LmbE family N-acetylglucosaminyl deacetylase
VGPLSGMLALHGHLVVDISDTIERKEASIRCYKTQFPPEKENLFQRIDSAARFLGSTAGVEAAELFMSPRPVVNKDLMASLFA